MPSIRVEWDNAEHTRLLFEFYAPYTWVEFHEGIQDVHQRTLSVAPQTVDIIIWMKVGLPEGTALTQVRSVFKTHPANTGKTIIVSEQSTAVLAFTKRMAMVVQSLFPGKANLKFVNSLEEARNLAPAIKANA